MKKGLLRIIDANLNRSREGLRVCEEITRFVLNSADLTRELKYIRHKISDILKHLPVKAGGFLDSRDVGRDVGRRSATRSERKRVDWADILAANIERVKEALRVLEEAFKLADERSAAAFKALRFRIYVVEKKALKEIAKI